MGLITTIAKAERVTRDFLERKYPTSIAKMSEELAATIKFRNLLNENLKDIADFFDTFDKDGGKELTLAEFKKGLKDKLKFGSELDDGADGFFENMDCDGNENGTVSLDEIFAYLFEGKFGSKARSELIKKVWKGVDTHSDGRISKSELKAAFKKEDEWEAFGRSLNDNFDLTCTVTEAQFTHYYASKSADFESDDAFTAFVKEQWNLPL